MDMIAGCNLNDFWHRQLVEGAHEVKACIEMRYCLRIE